MAEQVKSKQRVVDHGEVFTNEREVNAMLDLVKQETERIDSRFLEPACGNGNFLAEILRRKIEVVKRNYKKSPHDFEKYMIVAITSIYGVELQADNVEECRERLFNIWNEEYSKNCKEANDEVREVAKFIFRRNILQGNALSLVKVDMAGNDIPDDYITFSEWSLVMGDKIKRRDFRLDVLLRENDDEDNYAMNFSLFDDASNTNLWETDPVTNEVIPKPIEEYPLTDYRRLNQYE